MGSIVAAIQPAIDRARQNDSEEFYIETIKRNVMLQIQRLQASPVLHDLVEQGKLKIVGAYYSLKTGESQSYIFKLRGPNTSYGFQAIAFIRADGVNVFLSKEFGLRKTPLS